MIDILVAGGGPAGLATALNARRAGLSVVVAEPRDPPIDKACGEGLMPAAVDELARLGVELPGHPFVGIRYCAGLRSASAAFRRGCGMGVRRTELQLRLHRAALDAGVQIVDTPVRSVVQHPDSVSVDGRLARYLVGADGLHSRLRRLAGIAATADASPGGRAGRGLSRRHGNTWNAPPRYGLRQHFRVAPWTDLVEVYWTSGAEAYVTPVAPDEVGVALLFTGSGSAAGPGGSAGAFRGGSAAAFAARLAAFPALLGRLGDADPASTVRGAGPMRQEVPRRTADRVLLIGDASGYLDALTGEGIGVALAQAQVLARCLAADRPGDYERAWRRVSRPAWRLTAGLLWSRNRPPLAPLIVPAAQRLPWLFSALVNHAAQA